MCGRFVQYSDSEIYASRYALDRVCEAAPRYNLAPTQPLLAVRVGGDGLRELVPLRWGLVPGWSKGPDSRYSMINARAESVAEKPAYRGAFRHRRCLIPAEGFYEWRSTPSGKQPYLIRRCDGEPFAMAGLWERWQRGEEAALESCTIVVTAANSLIRPIHDRMPAVLASESLAAWLDPGNQDTAALASLLRPASASDWTLLPVSRRVNSPRNDDAELLAPVEATA
jgi:putative SOS response-associated peptidase YedK